MTEKKSPNLAAAVEKDLTTDLKKVGGFLRGLAGFTEKATKAVQVITGPSHPEGSSPPKAIGRGQDIVVQASPCDVCGGDGVVGGVKKIPCPACTASPRK
jgi:hypothetical protein